MLESLKCPICHRLVLWDPNRGRYRSRPHHLYHYQCQKLLWYRNFADVTHKRLVQQERLTKRMAALLAVQGFKTDAHQ